MVPGDGRAAPPLTKIVATVGPASRDGSTLGRLLAAGVDVVRLNFSHGTHAEHAAVAAAVRALAAEGRHVALLADLQGPKLRVGDLAGGGPVELVAGETVTVVTAPVAGTAARFSVTHDRLGEDVRPGDRVLLDDGLLELRVEAVERHEGAPDAVTCRVVHGGLLRERKGLNLPGVAVSVPALTPKDREDLAFAVAQGVDYVALSFVRAAADVRAARREIRRLGGRQGVIAKIEKPQALADLEAIVRAADGVMVARGDLGVEVGPEAVPLAQKRIIRLANAAGVPVITATQMLESMVANPRPTRAEASDVANAILDGTDAVMLSGETAIGAHPVAAVETMARLARAVEADPAYRLARPPAAPTGGSDAEAVANAARSLAADLGCRAVAVLTRTGRTAGRVAGGRPGVPVVALTDRPEVARRLALWHGVRPVLGPLPVATDAAVAAAARALLAHGHAAPGDRVIVTGAARPTDSGSGRALFLQVLRLDPG